MSANGLIDNYKHKGARKSLIEELKRKGIKSEQVLEAMMRVPRHYFFDKTFWDRAYLDIAHPIGEGQTISQPYTVAYQTELLNVSKNDKILEIGTGSGYQCCVLLELGAKVYTIERQKTLYDRCKLFLPAMGYKAHFLYGDGSKGNKIHGPYDKIIVTAGAPTIPQALMGQLTIGGILVIPVGDEKTQKMHLIQRISEQEFQSETLESFRFVPLIGEQAW
jgi:protein-L-isoaspartate(D-aspartate) O-methyltransferase